MCKLFAFLKKSILGSLKYMVEKKKEKNKQKVVKNGKKLGEMEFKIREQWGAYDSRILIVRSFDYIYLISYPKEV